MKKYTTVKAFVKEALKKNGYTLISPSFFVGENNTFLFNAYDKYGNPYSFFLDIVVQYATIQSLSAVMVHDAHDANFIFFE